MQVINFFYLFSKSLTFKRDELDRSSQKAGRTLNALKAEAELYGNNRQLERMKEKLNFEASK